jgi:hypothetical protein
MTEREKDLMSFGKPIICPSCGETSYLYPKGVGHQPYMWEINCSLCHRFNEGLNAYFPEHTETVKALQKLRERYLEGESTQELKPEMMNLSKHLYDVIGKEQCECGGTLSIIDKPKCIYCDIEIFDSYFHVADEPPQES